MSKDLIVYFSRNGNNYVDGSIRNLETGNTEIVANRIKELIGADIIKIQPVNEYSADYYICIEEAMLHKNDNARPEIRNPIYNLDRYENIYLAYPNYWSTMPMHVWTFLEQYDFSGKKIIPFCTHEGSGMGTSEKDIQKLCPGAIVEKGVAIRGRDVGTSKSILEKIEEIQKYQAYEKRIG